MISSPIAKFKYCNLKQKIELFSEIYYIGVVKLSMSGVVLPSVVSSFINYFIYNMGEDSFFLSYPIVYVQFITDELSNFVIQIGSKLFYCRLPFNWRTPHGYLIALIFESIASFTVGSFVVPPICFFIGSCFLITSFVNDITVKIAHLHVNKRSEGRNQRIEEDLINIIDDISEVNELSIFIFAQRQ